MFAAGANEGTFVELRKGGARPGRALEYGELVPWNRADRAAQPATVVCQGVYLRVLSASDLKDGSGACGSPISVP